MNAFTYTRVPDLAEGTREIAANAETRLIAGGTNLLDLMKENAANQEAGKKGLRGAGGTTRQ